MSIIRAALGGLALTSVFSLGAYAADLAAGPLVAPDWLAENLEHSDLAVLDIRNRIDGGSAEVFAAGHVPGAVYSNYLDDGWRVAQGDVPGMLPEITDLEALIGGLGIANDDHVVIVPAGASSTDLGSATRVYWTFKVLGHDAISILDGGYKAWADGERPVETGIVEAEAASFTAEFRPELLATDDDVRAAIDDSEITLIDARPVEQFLGLGQHPAAQSAGTIPGSINAPQESLATFNGSQMRDPQTLDYLFDQAGVADDQPNIAFCNTGHWASIAWFASSELLGQDSSLYDGSMVEWTADPENPMSVSALASAAE